MGIYSFTIQEVSPGHLAVKKAELEKDGLEVNLQGFPTTVNEKGIIEGDVKGHHVKIGYSWVIGGNLDIQILDKPFLASNSTVEHYVRDWFKPSDDEADEVEEAKHKDEVPADVEQPSTESNGVSKDFEPTTDLDPQHEDKSEEEKHTNG